MRGEGKILDWYEGLRSSNQLLEDQGQKKAALLLQQFNNENAYIKNITRLFKPNVPKGVYIYGSVGQGKTLLMDGFYLNTSITQKWRVHFHSFMRHFHQEMSQMGDINKEDKISTIAANLSKKYRLICFDEFHISDIADAMILGALLRQLFRYGMKFVMTSNYSPADLYPNGLARHLFLPTIDLLEENCRVFNLCGYQDYRQLQLSKDGLYFYPLNQQTQKSMETSFARLACGIWLEPKVIVQGRRIEAVQRSSDAVWFSFNTLCQGAYSHLDYLRLAERFSTLFLSDVPQLADNDDAARRFTWLIDILYDNKTNLILSAAAPLHQLYTGKEGGEKGRTLSRLKEMQSHTYQQCQ